MIKKVCLPRLRDANFSIVPIPLEDEVFSSWLVRTAYAHKTHPHTFANQYLDFRYNSFFRRDPDLTMTQEAVRELEKKCYGKVDIYDLTLKSYTGSLQEQITDVPNSMLGDLKYCPVCLREDKIPYFRKKWHIIFYNVCHHHRCYLYDHCPQCQNKLDISKMYEDEMPYTYCHKCGGELSKARKLTVHKNHVLGLEHQNALMDILERGYVVLGDRWIYSFNFFEVFVQLSKIILARKKYRFIDMHPVYGLLKGIDKRGYHYNMPVYKQVTVKQRFSLYSMIVHLFENYPVNFREYIRCNELTHWDMVKDMEYVPFWYANMLIK